MIEPSTCGIFMMVRRGRKINGHNCFYQESINYIDYINFNRKMKARILADIRRKSNNLFIKIRGQNGN